MDRQIAWWPAHASCLDACARVVSQVVGQDECKVRVLLQHAQGVPWTISNKYFEADVEHVCVRGRPEAQKRPAIVLLVPHTAHRAVHERIIAEAVDGHDASVSLVVGLPVEGDTPDVDELDAWYGQVGWEYIAPTNDTTRRISEALMVHPWPDMRLTGRGHPQWEEAPSDDSDSSMGEFQSCPPNEIPMDAQPP